MIGPHDVTSIFGVCGSGKSTLSRNLSAIYPRLIIFDRLGEWGDIDGLSCTDEESFSKIWKQAFRSPSFKYVHWDEVYGAFGVAKNEPRAKRFK